MPDLLTRQPAPTTSTNAILRATELKKTFKMGEHEITVLKHVDLSVRHGEFVAIEGKSGSGKSTLLHILSGLDAPNAGSVEYDGNDIAALAMMAASNQQKWRWYLDNPVSWPARLIVDLISLTSLSSAGKSDRALTAIRNTQFGFVFQFYHLLPELNVLENTLISAMIEHSWFGYRARKNDLVSRAAAVLEEMGLGHRLKHRPNELSGGERQRVAIARALMNEPKVLFADEPTGNLDAETGRQIMDVLEKLHQEKGQTILMVTHDRTLAREADRVLLLKDGRLTGEAER